MENKLFRKTALDRISSPEQLNEYMKVAGPGVWCILAGLGVTFAAFIVWGFLGVIPETVVISGTALDPDGSPMGIYSLLSIEESRELEVGMKVRVSPDYAPRERYGYIYGTIQSISHTPVTAETLLEELGDDKEFIYIPSGNLIKVVVALETYDNGELKWSSSRGAGIELILGSTCTLTVITAELKPYELMFS